MHMWNHRYFMTKMIHEKTYSLSFSLRIVQRSPLFCAPSLVKLAPAVARLFCLALPGSFLTMFCAELRRLFWTSTKGYRVLKYFNTNIFLIKLLSGSECKQGLLSLQSTGPSRDYVHCIGYTEDLEQDQNDDHHGRHLCSL